MTAHVVHQFKEFLLRILSQLLNIIHGINQAALGKSGNPLDAGQRIHGMEQVRAADPGLAPQIQKLRAGAGFRHRTQHGHQFRVVSDSEIIEARRRSNLQVQSELLLFHE